MLTQQQREDFCKATGEWNGNDFNLDCSVCEPEDVATTRDSLENFKSGPAKNGKYKTIDTPAGILHIFENFQVRKCARRGNAFVMDFGDARAVYFTGE